MGKVVKQHRYACFMNTSFANVIPHAAFSFMRKPATFFFFLSPVEFFVVVVVVSRYYEMVFFSWFYHTYFQVGPKTYLISTKKKITNTRQHLEQQKPLHNIEPAVWFLITRRVTESIISYIFICIGVLCFAHSFTSTNEKSEFIIEHSVTSNK